ncbi:MAG TPA: hypothetical protein VF049_22315 [Nocardioidaceae bacterium]
MDIRAVDLPELRAEVLAYYNTPTAHDTWRRMAENGMFLVPGIDGEQLLAAEIRRLRRETYWVSPEMTQLACAAAPTMPGFTIQEHDLPSLYGFMYFAQPIADTQAATRAGDAMTVSIVACSWGPVYADDGSTGLWISLYTPTGTPEVLLQAHGYDSMAHAQRARAALPSLMYDNELLVPFGTDVNSAITPGLLHDTAGRVIRAVWSLMQQPLAEQQDIEPDRATRKRLRRAGQEPKPVRVIELRRPKNASSTDSGPGNYHHQWIVRGHWRQHWYPKRQVHRPVWIAPHVKGPEGAPLIGGEKVYALKR